MGWFIRYSSRQSQIVNRKSSIVNHQHVPVSPLLSNMILFRGCAFGSWQDREEESENLAGVAAVQNPLKEQF
jgi:hypothetical protein